MSRKPGAAPAAGDSIAYADLLAAHETRRRAADDIRLRKMIDVLNPQQPPQRRGPSSS